MYRHKTMADFLGDRVVYRNLQPCDPALPNLADIWQEVGLESFRVPRKTEPVYAAAVYHFLQMAQAQRGEPPLERLLVVGDTPMNDGTAAKNLAKYLPMRCFIGCEKLSEAKHIEIQESLMIANRWQSLADFLDWVLAEGFIFDEQTALLLDLDKTALGARGRNDKAIDEARIAAVCGTVEELLGGDFDETACGAGFRADAQLPRLPENRIYWSDIGTAPPAIRRAHLDGSRVETVFDGFIESASSALNIDEISGHLYWMNFAVPGGVDGVIVRADSDGSNAEIILENDADSPFTSSWSFAIDPVEEHIYFSNFVECSLDPRRWCIERINFDGTGRMSIVDAASPIWYIDLDLIEGKIYWLAMRGQINFSYFISRSNLDGTENEDIIRAVEGAASLFSVDEINGMMYWRPSETIVRANLDGSDIEDLGIPTVQRGHIFVDSHNDKIYYVVSVRSDTPPDPSHYQIHRSNIDGSDRELLIDFIPAPVWGLTVDVRPDLEHSFPNLLDGYDILNTAYALPDDLDGDGLPEIAALKLLERAAGIYRDPVGEAASLAYDTNLDLAANEANVNNLGDFREAVASLFLMSTGLRDGLLTHLADSGVIFDSDYTVVSCTTLDECMPSRFTTSSIRGVDEPLSGAGDADGDSVSNAEEYANVVERGGTLDDFARAATNPRLNGSETPGANGCFIATAAYGTPLADDINVLRRFRDAAMLNNPLGTVFADAYYRLSPPIADEVAASPLFARVVREALSPVLWMSKLWMGHRPWVIALLLFAAFGAGLRLNRRRVAAK